MRKLLLVCLLAVGCASIQPVPIPPRPPSTEWHVGITNAPFDEAEWTYFQWAPFWRVGPDQYSIVNRSSRVMLLLRTENDATVTAALPYLPKAWAVEMGNEPDIEDGGHDPTSVNGWYWRTIRTLRNSGYGGPICTAGVSNIEDNTLDWLQTSIAGLPDDIWICWHAYAGFHTPGQIGKLLALVGKHPHLMSEWGFEVHPGNDVSNATQATADLVTIKASGARGAFYYQMHSDPKLTELKYGIHDLDGSWHSVEQSLKGAS